MEIRIRTARPLDAEALLKIYAPYVKDTAITFEYEVPDVVEFQARIEHTLEKYPYLVAEKDGEILGYAYAGSFVGRAAYDWSAETSIYVDRNNQKSGLGRKLYTALEDAMREMGYYNLNACIGYPEVEDEHLTGNSVRFHEHMGYKWVGLFHNSGYKFDTWYHMVWMEKMLGQHPVVAAPVRKYSDVREIMRSKYGID